jgi:ABC-type phosphate transport system ATPase subunit
MKLSAFSVKNYRSILKAEKLPIRESLTVLIGPNNEGKSNILSALTNSLRILQRLDRYTPATRARGSRQAASLTLLRGPFRERDREYEWQRDFPVSLQESTPKGMSVFDLDFSLTDDELQEFKSRVGSKLNGILPVRLELGQVGVKFSVRKQGRGAKTLSAKVRQIARFASEKVDFQYIPAIRTAEEARSVVARIVERELAVVEGDPKYSAALEAIAKLQEPILEKISENVTKTLQEFLPEVTSVSVGIPPYSRSRALRRATEIIVDDGAPTPLERKGDGIVSLSAISLMRYASSASAAKRNLILAIEEPESHLHPRGIHRLHEVIREIAREHQVIITTHNQGFVEQADVKANLIVQKTKAKPAKSIAEIRDSLGVRVSDNLQNSEVVLVIEGEDDRTALLKLLAHMSPTLRRAITNNRLGIDSLSGGTNLCYKLSHLRLSLCRVHCLLDFDQCGRQSVENAENQGHLVPADVTFTRVGSMPDAEIEDCYVLDVYKDALQQTYGAIFDSHFYTQHRGKWSDRVRNSFENQGMRWDRHVEARIKAEVAELVATSPGHAIRTQCRPVFMSLCEKLETMLRS